MWEYGRCLLPMRIRMFLRQGFVRCHSAEWYLITNHDFSFSFRNSSAKPKLNAQILKSVIKFSILVNFSFSCNLTEPKDDAFTDIEIARQQMQKRHILDTYDIHENREYKPLVDGINSLIPASAPLDRNNHSTLAYDDLRYHGGEYTDESDDESWESSSLAV